MACSEWDLLVNLIWILKVFTVENEKTTGISCSLVYVFHRKLRIILNLSWILEIARYAPRDPEANCLKEEL